MQLNSTNLGFQPIIITYAPFPPGPSYKQAAAFQSIILFSDNMNLSNALGMPKRGGSMSQFDWYVILRIIMIIHVYCSYLQAHFLLEM